MKDAVLSDTLEIIEESLLLWRAFSRLPLGANVAVVRWTIAKGELENKPFDASSMAFFIGLPRTTVLRALKQLEAGGDITRRRNGRRVEIILTEIGWQQVAESLAQL